jgi:hypothetical protein
MTDSDCKGLTEARGDDGAPIDVYKQFVDMPRPSGARFPAWAADANKSKPLDNPLLRQTINAILTKCRLLNTAENAREFYDTLRRLDVFKDSKFTLPDIDFDMHEDYCEALAWAFGGVLADKTDNSILAVNQAVNAAIERIVSEYTENERAEREARRIEYESTGRYINDSVYGAKIPMSVAGKYSKYTVPLSYSARKPCAPNQFRNWTGHCVTIGSPEYNAIMKKYGAAINVT